MDKKKLIAYAFVLIMLVRGFAALASVPSSQPENETGSGSGISECVNVDSGIVISTISVPHSTYDVGQTIPFTVSTTYNPDSASEGGHIYAYVDGSCKDGWNLATGTETFTYTPTSDSSVTFYVHACYAFDAGHGIVDDTGNSPTGTITVNSNISSVSISASHNPADAGQSFSSSISGGTSPYTYSWTIYNGDSTSDSSLATSSSSSFSYTFGSSGYYLVTLSVTDATGDTYSNSMTETVDPALSLSLSETHNPSDLGQSITYDSSVSGGSGTYSSYSYVLYNGTSTSDGELASGSTSSFSYTYD
ncbi:hypothetical protein SE19_01705, partial [Acidiplasma aeolicum]